MRLIDADKLRHELIMGHDLIGAKYTDMADTVEAIPIEWIEETARIHPGYDIWMILEEWEECPQTVEAEPVRHGHWIKHYDDLFPAESTQECSVCHAEQMLTMLDDNYCPHCGAKMEGGENETD